MFSQRNNPYCELLKSEAKVMIISRINNFFNKKVNMKKILGLDLGTNSMLSNLPVTENSSMEQSPNLHGLRTITANNNFCSHNLSMKC